MTAIINRPWTQSFNFVGLPFSDRDLGQFHKLTRNFVASLDLGCPSAKHTQVFDHTDISGLNQHERYLLWVKTWKNIYLQLSRTIRMMKLYRKTVHFPKLASTHRERLEALNRGYNGPPEALIRDLSARHLERLQEDAQVLLNARWNAKLASREARRRRMEEYAEKNEVLANAVAA